MIERGEQIDDVIFFDTGWDFPQMLEHVAEVEKDLITRNIKFTRLKPPYPFEYLMIDHVLKRGKRKGTKGYGWPKPHARYCTTYKTQTINKYLKQFNDVIQCIGIAADEPKRIKDKRYPLVEYGMTEKDCLEYCYSIGFDFNGLYKSGFKRVSCFCCPLQSLKDLEIIFNEYPDLWQKIEIYDSKTHNDFRNDYSIDELKEKFSR